MNVDSKDCEPKSICGAQKVYTLCTAPEIAAAALRLAAKHALRPGPAYTKGTCKPSESANQKPPATGLFKPCRLLAQSSPVGFDEMVRERSLALTYLTSQALTWRSHPRSSR